MADSIEQPVAQLARLPVLEDMLRDLRRCAEPCEPPVGVGAFDVLYASAREVVVWYSPARPEHRPGEVAIPTARLAGAWRALLRGEALDEAALERLGEGVAGGRWLLAVLAQVPGVRARGEPLALEWSPPAPADLAGIQAAYEAAPDSLETTGARAPSRRRRKRAM